MGFYVEDLAKTYAVVIVRKRSWPAVSLNSNRLKYLQFDSGLISTKKK